MLNALSEYVTLEVSDRKLRIGELPSDGRDAASHILCSGVSAPECVPDAAPASPVAETRSRSWVLH